MSDSSVYVCTLNIIIHVHAGFNRVQLPWDFTQVSKLVSLTLQLHIIVFTCY